MVARTLGDEQKIVPLCEPTGGELFDVDEFIPELFRHGQSKFACLGCPKAAECSRDLVMDFIYPEKPKTPQWCTLENGKILINIPGARNSKGFLFHHITYKIRTKHKRCRDCNPRLWLPIDRSPNEAGEPRTESKTLVDPATPYDTYKRTEIIEQALAVLSDDLDKEIFKRYLLGFTHEETARHFNLEPATVRKRFSRLMNKIAESLGGKFPE